MDAGGEGLVTGMLGLEHGDTAHLVFPIHEPVFIVVLFHVFSSKSLGPGEGDHCCDLFLAALVGIGGLLEVVLGVTLSTGQGTHVLERQLVQLLSAFFKRTLEIRSGEFQLTGLCVVAVGTTDGVHDLGTCTRPLACEEFQLAFLFHQAGNVGGFTGPTRHGHGAVISTGGATRAKCVSVALKSEGMAAGRVVVFGETVSGPQDDKLRILFKLVFNFGAFTGLFPAIVLMRIVFAPFITSGFYTFFLDDRCGIE